MSKAKRAGNTNVDDSENDPERLWCVCHTPYVPGQFMIQCDQCNEWYHGECVNITPEIANKMTEKNIPYYCPSCSQKKPQNRTRGGQFLTDNSQPKPQKNIRAEAVKHMQTYLKKAIDLVRRVIKLQLEKNTNALSEDQTEGVQPLTDAEREERDNQDKQLVILYEDDEKLKDMATAIEKSISDLHGSEHDKPYRYQYRGLKAKLDDPNEHQFRLDVLLGKRTPESLGNEDVSAYPADKKSH